MNYFCLLFSYSATWFMWITWHALQNKYKYESSVHHKIQYFRLHDGSDCRCEEDACEDEYVSPRWLAFSSHLVIGFIVRYGSADVVDQRVNEVLTLPHRFPAIWTSGAQISGNRSSRNHHICHFSNIVQWEYKVCVKFVFSLTESFLTKFVIFIPTEPY